MSLAQTIYFLLEIAGITAFAVSGAMIAISRRMDLFGIVFIGATSALGGGITRDILIGRLPPQMFSNYIYLLVAVISSAGVILVAMLFKETRKKRIMVLDSVINVFDALGLGVFSVSGAKGAISAGFEKNIFLVVFVSMITGIGGGMLRDIMCRHIPFVLSKRIYALASLVGALVYVYVRRVTQDVVAAFIGIAVIFAIRMCATAYEWDLPKIQ